ncbi:MAG: hypothetical protein AAB663_00945 [Patescibacteria group bacterium]
MFAQKSSLSLPPSLLPCHVWADGLVLTHGEAAREVMVGVAHGVTSLAVWKTTPQSAPHHTEGAVLADHVCRMLAVLLAVGEGADVCDIEELAREKDLRLDVASLTETLRNYRPLLTAFAVAHDMAKPETAFFDAHVDTKGAAEGFGQHGLRGEKLMTDAERVRYDKLFRAFAASHASREGAQLQGAFFDAYGITVHYDRHGAVAASPAYAEDRDRIVAHFDLPLSQGKMLAELIRYHIDTIHAFNGAADAKAYEILSARAGKAGLNVDQFLDLALAVMFLDAVAGSVQYHDGKLFAQTGLVIHMLRAEREAAPQRHEAREFAAQQKVKHALKDKLAAALLDGESVFALLGTPLGPVRGEVYRRVQAAIDDDTSTLDFGEHTPELRRRISEFRSSL